MYEYKGFKYEPVEDVEEDNIKIFHDVVDPEGRPRFVHHSPYSFLSKQEFGAWVDRQIELDVFTNGTELKINAIFLADNQLTLSTERLNQLFNLVAEQYEYWDGEPTRASYVVKLMIDKHRKPW